MTATTEKALFSANTLYAPVDFRAILASQWASQGVVNLGSASTFATAQAGTPAMTVVVGPGMGLIEDSRGTALVRMVLATHTTASTTLPIAAADPSNPRIDLLVLRVEQIEMGDGSDVPGSIEIVTGTPAGSPSAPATPSGAIALYRVAVGAAVTSIVNANLTDVRVYAVPLGPASQFIRAAATSSKSSDTALANDAELVLSITAGTWEVSALVGFASGSSTAGVNTVLSFSGTATSIQSNSTLFSTGSGTMSGHGISLAAFATAGSNGVALPLNSTLTATLTATTSGTLAVQWAQSVSNATPTVRGVGSNLRATKIA